MNALFNRRIKHTTAWVMLLVWLFAVSAGMANACLLEEHGPHGHVSAANAMADDHPGVTAGHRVVADDEHAGPADQRPSKAACLKVCDETPQSLVKQLSNPGLDSPALAVAISSPWSTLPSVQGVDAHSAAWAQVPPSGPPPRVKFSRLAL